MKKLLILTAALFAVISCTKEEADPEVVITTLTGTQFSLSQFEVHTFPATDVWVIEDQSATTSDFAGLSAAIEYISSSDATRQIELEFANLTSIPSYAIYGVAISDSFCDFTALSSISAPYVSTVGAYAFEFCDGLQEIDIPNLETVGAYAFRGCGSLKSLSLPYVTTLDNSAFSGCSSLLSISLPLLEMVADQSFAYCSSLVSISIPEAVEIGSGAFCYNSSLVSFSAPSAISLGERALSECSSLQSISTPNMQLINSYAFSACTSLESFTIEEYVASLGDGLFNDCSSLTEIIDESELFVFESGILYDLEQTEIFIALPSVVEGDLTLPESVIEIRPRAFYGCSQITSLQIPSVEVIEEATFAHCTAITDVTLTSTTTLGDNAFYNSLLMESFSGPELKIIGNKSFYNCERLATLGLATNAGVALEYIDDHAFHSVYIEYTTLTVGQANADYVKYGDTLTVDLYTAEFESIIVLES